MGYLDHSTNNIILDAVLTDYGRSLLARANGSFNVSSFSFADDEVDYSIIKKYGRTVGKEKIEKNTPIFEAITNESQAIKYRLIGMEDQGRSIVYLPVLNIAGIDPSAQAWANVFNVTPSVPATISLSLTIKNSQSNVTSDFIQNQYTISVSDRFFTINPLPGSELVSSDAASLINPGDPNRTAQYKLSTTQTNFGFRVIANNIDQTTLSVYGKLNSSNQRVITSYITVTGDRHGCSINIPVTYTGKT